MMAGDNSAKAAEAAVAAMERKPMPETITLSNGIVLRLKSIPPFLVRRVSLNLERPKPPKVFLEDKGREEENPNDPAYLEALEEWESVEIEAGVDVMLLAGTEVVSVPDGKVGPDKDEWLELPDYFGVQVEKVEKHARYLAWLRYYALGADDIFNLTRALQGRVGLTEEEVKAAADSFPNRAARRANKRISGKTP